MDVLGKLEVELRSIDTMLATNREEYKFLNDWRKEVWENLRTMTKPKKRAVRKKKS